MGRRGFAAQPTVLKIARGNPGKRPINAEEPQLSPAGIEIPASLKGNGKAAARAEWNRLASELVTKGLLTTGDLVTFETYCHLVGEVGAYDKLITKVGRTDAHKLGYAGYLLKLRGQLKQYAAELGLTPSSRSGVKAVKVASLGAKEAKDRRFFGGGKSA